MRPAPSSNGDGATNGAPVPVLNAHTSTATEGGHTQQQQQHAHTCSAYPTHPHPTKITTRIYIVYSYHMTNVPWPCELHHTPGYFPPRLLASSSVTATPMAAPSAA